MTCRWLNTTEYRECASCAPPHFMQCRGAADQPCWSESRCPGLGADVHFWQYVFSTSHFGLFLPKLAD
eukprot:3204697-Amphidinium_carterae.1